MEGAGKLTSSLNDAFLNLPEEHRKQIKEECNAYAYYLTELSSSSQSGMKFDKVNIGQEIPISRLKRSFTSRPSTREQSLESFPTRTRPGPGVFLRRWQEYVNATVITAAKVDGPLRYGCDPDVVAAGAIGGVSSSGSPLTTQAAVAKEVDKKAPSCVRTVELLAGKFREILRESRQVVDNLS